MVTIDLWKNAETMPVPLVSLLKRFQKDAGEDKAGFYRLVLNAYDWAVESGDSRKAEDLREWIIRQLTPAKG